MALSNHFVHPSAFCWNPQCPDYAKVKPGNIRRFGRTQAGTQRFQCKTCKHTFVETIGTVFYGRHHAQQTIVECLALVAERNSLAAIHRVKGVKEETVLAWLRIAALHVERIEALLLANYRLNRAQLDALCGPMSVTKAKKGIPRNPGERYLLARHHYRHRHASTCWAGHRQNRRGGCQGADEPKQDRRGHPDVPPAMMASDGKGGYREALLQTWGEVPEY